MIFPRRRRRSSAPERSRPIALFEHLESRRVLSVGGVLPGVNGTVYLDTNANAEVDAGEAIAGATVNLYQDDGDGAFDPARDPFVATLTTDELGAYCFDDLDLESYYFVEQSEQTVAGVKLQQMVSPRVDGVRIGLVIDEFESPQVAIGSGNPFLTGNVAPTIFLGGERDVLLSGGSDTGGVILSSGVPEDRERLTLILSPDTNAVASVVWDGFDEDPFNVTPALGGFDLTGANRFSGFYVRGGTDVPGPELTLTMYAGPELLASSAIPIPIPVAPPTTTDLIYLPFTEFDDSVSPSAIDALELSIASANDSEVNLGFESVGLIEPTIVDMQNIVSGDLQVTFDAVPDNVIAGTAIEFSFTVSNFGPAAALAVELESLLSSSLDDVTFSSTTIGLVSGNTEVGVGAPIDTLAMEADSSATYFVSANVRSDALGSLLNEVVITPGPSDPDDVVSDNRDTSTTDVRLAADLSVLKTDSLEIVQPGDILVYSIAATNNGPSDVDGAILEDLFPDDLENITYTTTVIGSVSGADPSGAGDITDTLRISAGSSIIYEVNATVSREATDALSNTTTIEAPIDVLEIDALNNISTDTNTVVPLSTITGQVMEDLLGNGVDAGDLPFSNVEVQLYGDNGDGVLNLDDTLLDTVTTNEDGDYRFEDLRPGTYFIQLVPPSGFLVTQGSSMDDNTVYLAVVDVGTSPTDLDFGLFGAITIQGTKWNDLTGNGISMDDEPLEGTQIEVFADDGDGQFNDENDLLIASRFTDTLGAFEVTGLGPGLYFVREIVPDRFLQTEGPDGEFDAYAITAFSQDIVPGLDFANFGLARISGVKWEDTLGDGITEDDFPLEGTEIQIFQDDGDGNFDEFVDPLFGTTPTDAVGRYAFEDLPPGEYFVTEIVPDGFLQTDGGEAGTGFYRVLAQSQDDRTGLDFANFGFTEFRGIKWDDLTGDGFSADDVPLAGSQIQLFQDNGDGVFEEGNDELISTQVTDAFGQYAFLNLVPGLYFVTELPSDETVQTDGGNGDDDFYSITAISRRTQNDLDFATFGLATFGGTKWEDLLGDGVTLDDVPLAGTEIRIHLDDGNGIFEDTIDPLWDTAFTSENGTYRFDGLGPGLFFVTELTTDTFLQTGGGNDGNPYYTLATTSGGIVEEFDFANFGFASFSGTKWEDRTGDGISGDDTTLPEVEMQLYQDDGDGRFDDTLDLLVDSTLTNTTGAYLFDNLGPGLFFIAEITPEDFVQIEGGNDGNDFYSLATTSQTDLDTIDFANFGRVTISGNKFDDLTGDGISEDDLPLAGTQIRLFQDDGDGQFDELLDTLRASETTDDDGQYRFGGVGPGLFFIQEVVPEGFLQTDGGNEQQDFYAFVITSQNDIEAVDFANARLGIVSGNVWDDANRDGQAAAPEVGLEGWTVVLLGDEGETAAQTTSDAEGNYEFRDLLPGDYTIRVVAQSGWESTSPGTRYEQTLGIATGGWVTGAVDVADLDGDGIPEIIAVNDTPASIVILSRGAGDSLYEITRTLTLDSGSRPQFVLAEDLDDDGDQDLVVATIGMPRTPSPLTPTEQSNALVIIENLDQEELRFAGSIAAGHGPVSLTAAHFDQDSHVDLAVANVRGRTISILHGAGNLRFEPWQTLQAGSEPMHLASGDIDGDGDQDLVVPLHGEDSVQVFQNNGSGSLRLRERLKVAGPAAVLLADLTQNGAEELVVTSHTGNAVLVFSGGTDSFDTRTNVPVPAGPQFLDAADINGDGILDLAIAASDGSTATVVYSQGDGVYSREFSYEPAAVEEQMAISPQQVVAADLDADGDQDLVVSHQVLGISVLQNEHVTRNVSIDFGDEITEQNFGSVQAIVADNVQPVAGKISQQVLSAPPPEEFATGSTNALDVNGDGYVSAIDALLVINQINSIQDRDGGNGQAAVGDPLDVNRDGFVSAIDSLYIVNALNQNTKPPENAASPLANGSSPDHNLMPSVVDSVFSQAGPLDSDG